METSPRSCLTCSIGSVVLPCRQMARQLEKLLEEQTRAGKEAEAELLARQDEKAQLLRLLKHKDGR